MELPLHPLMVHLPLGLMALLPLVAFAIWIGIRIQLFNSQSWLIVVLLHVILLGSVYFAIETGQDEEHKVEKVVAEKYIEKHEEAAELLLWVTLSSMILTLAATPDFSGRGKYVQLIAILGMLATGAFAIQTGHSGGELVYEHHASQAYKKSVGLIPQPKETIPATKLEELDDGDDANEEEEDIEH